MRIKLPLLHGTKYFQKCTYFWTISRKLHSSTIFRLLLIVSCVRNKCKARLPLTQINVFFFGQILYPFVPCPTISISIQAPPTFGRRKPKSISLITFVFPSFGPPKKVQQFFFFSSMCEIRAKKKIKHKLFNFKQKFSHSRCHFLLYSFADSKRKTFFLMLTPEGGKPQIAIYRRRTQF